MTDEQPSAVERAIACAEAPFVIPDASIEDAAPVAVAHVAAWRAAHRDLPRQAPLEVRSRRSVNGIVRASHVRAG